VVSVEEDYDPEYPEDTDTVVTAVTDLPWQEILPAEKQWIRALFGIWPGEDSPRLNVRPNS
jgi:hypothetical protein